MTQSIKQRITFALFCVLHRRSLAAQKRWQAAHLRRLVRYAYAHIPLYKRLFDEKGISPTTIRTLDDVSLLPVTSKQTFLGKMTEEYIDSSRPVNSRWYVTSGTSGIPLRFLLSPIAIDDAYTDFASFRFLWWLGKSPRSISTINIARIKIRAPSGEHRLFIPVGEYLTNPEGAITRLAQFKTDILYAYPSILLDMARLLSRDKTLPRPPVRFLLSFGEMLTPSVRRFLTETFKCEVYDRYGLEEIGIVGVECKEHDGFHINTESVLVEITDDSYVPVTQGTEGKIIATDLYNFGMPFIRYDTGDKGRISDEPCACGLRSPRLWLEGRYSAYLTFPERRIHHLEFDGAMDGFMNYIFQYQIAKKSDTDLVARIVPGPAFYPPVIEKIRENLQKLTGSSVRVAVDVVDTLPITPRGKSRIVADESTYGERCPH